VGMGILPLTFINGENSTSLGIEGTEKVSIILESSDLKPNQDVRI
jgi:aconitase A